MNKSYQICEYCVMDTSAIDITFDASGRCNYCTDYLKRSGDVLNKVSSQRDADLRTLTNLVTTQGKGKRYDCIIGISGGVDSSWALVQAVKLGLRPLAVHMDNSWNTELAQNNISNLVRALNVDLFTYVIDWVEYRQLMQAFFDADVVDIELLYDNAMLAVNYQQARLHRIKYILAGTNQATEGMIIPPGWNWLKYDKRNIKALAWRFARMRLNTFPAIGTFGYLYNRIYKKIQWISFLDYLDYNKEKALNCLEKEYGYKRYPYKHYESIFTRFYQGFLLPQKYGIDKRRVHLSTLVASGQMSRDDALKKLKHSPYENEQNLQEDIQYFQKKMGWTNNQLEDYLKRPGKDHQSYPSEKALWSAMINAAHLFKKTVREKVD